MKANRSLKLTILLGSLVLLVAACDSGEEAVLTTTSSVVGSTSAPDVGVTDEGTDGTTSTTLTGQAVASHEVVLRESTDDGEFLYIVVPEGDYTDVDLENFLGNLIENDEEVTNVEVFDDAAAVTAFRLDDSDQTAADLVLISEHHLVSLSERNRIIYRGPYEEFGEIAIGS